MADLRSILLAAFVLLLLPSAAWAGSIGLFDQTGFHFGEALSASGGTGHWMDQGGGVELLLGSKGVRIKGRVRLSYAAIIDLDAPAGTVGTVQHSGIVAGGVHVELLPHWEEQVVGLYALMDVGVSPIVSHNRAYVFADAGAGLRFNAAERLSFFVEASGWVRFDKVLAGGPLFFVGARFELD